MELYRLIASQWDYELNNMTGRDTNFVLLNNTFKKMCNFFLNALKSIQYKIFIFEIEYGLINISNAVSCRNKSYEYCQERKDCSFCL
jgi:hypothetical protein